MTRLLALAPALIGASALAHAGATGIVMERMEGMSALGKAMKALSAEAKAAAPDPGVVAEAAAVLKAEAGETMLARFPEGSLQPASEALPVIWEDWDRFAALANELEVRAEALVSGDGPLPARFKAVTETCTACHEDFRQKK